MLIHNSTIIVTVIHQITFYFLVYHSRSFDSLKRELGIVSQTLAVRMLGYFD